MKKNSALILLVLGNLIVALIVLPGFGESTDELSQHSYAERTIEGVRSLFDTGSWSPYFFEEAPKQGSHGPAFIMIVTLLRSLFLPAGTGPEELNFSHFLYFLMFQVGTVSLFFLARRWMSEMAAFGTAFLFCTQPLFVGHAFMNPKDVVFMSLLIASATLGLRMTDREEEPHPPTVSAWIRSFFGQFLHGDVWLAGLMLGFASAVRIAAPLIGAVVLVHVLVSRKWQRVSRVIAYGLIAFGTMIVFWPYLWPDPIGRLLGSFLNSAYYPDVHATLFRGSVVDSQHIPFLYLPLLFAVQLTETLLLLLLIGIVSLLRRIRWDLVSLILIWFALPAAAIVLLRVSLYDNFRQVFFILPPLFLLAGVGMDGCLRLIRRPVSRALFFLVILLPGLYANITLYPYQYIYYNQLAGGLRGAYRVFELDYWDLAFREGQAYINRAAPQNADVFAGDSKPSAQTFARPDLIFNALGGRKKNWERYDYIIVSTAENNDEKFAEFPTVFVVQRDGVPLLYVKKPN